MSHDEELEALRAFEAGAGAASMLVSGDGDWLPFALVAALEAGRRVRAARFDEGHVRDEGGALPLERAIEEEFATSLAAARPGATLLGRSATTLPPGGEVVALDAIDGVRSFLAHDERCAVSLVVFKDGQPIVSVILNPVTGELVDACPGRPSRLLQLPLLGEEPVVRDLPLVALDDAKPVLVNLHPYQQASPFLRDLYNGWSRDYYKIQLIKAVGGSPSWALAEAAKGSFVYVNLWDAQPAAPDDLAPGAHVVRSAGGHVLGLRGEPVAWSGHEGLFVAGVHEAEVQAVRHMAEVVKANLESYPGFG